MKYLSLYVVLLCFVTSTSLAQQDWQEKADQYTYTNTDSCYHYANLLAQKAEKERDWLSGVKGLIPAAESSNYAKDYAKMRSTLLRIKEYVSHFPDSLDYASDQETAYAQYYRYYHGLYYYHLNDYARARPYFLKILETAEQLPDSITTSYYKDFVTSANSYLAVFYQLEYKYGVALEFYNENLRLHEKYKDNKTEVYQTKNLIASLLSDEKKFEASNKIAKESIAFYLKDGHEKNPNSLRRTSILLMNNYILTDQPDSALVYYKKVAHLYENNPKYSNSFLSIKAQINVLRNNYDAAINTHQTIITRLKGTSQNVERIAEAHRDLAVAYQKSGDLENALLHYNKSIDFFYPERNKTSDSMLQPAYRIDNLLSTLKEQSTLYNRVQDYTKTLDNGRLTAEKLYDLKRSFANDVDKQNLIDNVLPIFEESIEASYQLLNKTEDPKYIVSAFDFFELSKSPILLDALYRNNASNFKGIPEALFDSEKTLKLSIAALEKSLSQKKDLEKESTLFNLKRERDQLISKIEQDYPDYYNLKYSSETVSLEAFQQQLTPNLTVLSYFYGNQAIYAMSINTTKATLHKIPISRKRDSKIKNLNTLLADPTSSTREIADITHSIYRELLEKLITTNNKTKLLIIPDGLLHTIPFEVLSTDGSAEQLLVKTKATSYVNSATLWMRLQDNYENRKSFIGFAPSFDLKTDDQSFGALPNNIEEVHQALNHFNGKVYTGDEATLAVFKDKLRDHNIIHLATHAVANDQIPEYSFLAFANENSSTESLMYVNDLYLEDIKANLVMLSACETGVGTLEKGEGVISLSRAFFYSGAKSIVHTLWKNNDYSSSTITNDFYAGLAKGQHKDAALQQAKLNFLTLNKDNALTHPYYWSSFVVNGNTLPIQQQSLFKWYWILLSILLALILFSKPILKRFQ